MTNSDQLRPFPDVILSLMNILITGGHGMLGTSIQQVFSNHNLIVPEKRQLDVANTVHIKKFSKENFDIVFHLAALTDLQKAEEDSSLNHKINVIGTQNILKIAKAHDVPIVFISSAMVFNGKKSQYSERDLPSPINNYGKTKFDAEKIITGYKKHYILRNGWGFGGGAAVDKKFVNKIYQKIKEGSKKLYGITDIYGNPTYTVDFAYTLKNIIENKAPYGTYHVAGQGPVSRFEVLKALVNDLGASNKIEVIPLTLKKYLKLFPTPFAYIKNEVLSVEKIERLGLSSMHNWREALKEYIKELQKS